MRSASGGCGPGCCYRFTTSCSSKRRPKKSTRSPRSPAKSWKPRSHSAYPSSSTSRSGRTGRKSSRVGRLDSDLQLRLRRFLHRVVRTEEPTAQREQRRARVGPEQRRHVRGEDLPVDHETARLRMLVDLPCQEQCLTEEDRHDGEESGDSLDGDAA